MTATALVSAALEAELRLKIQRHGIVVWLDKDQSYTGFVDRLQAAAPKDMRVLTYRGSFLELMVALEPLTATTDKPPLVMHVPGAAAEHVMRSPLLEVERVGITWRKTLETLVTEAATGRARPEQVAAFLSERPTLERADAWLAGIVDAAAAGIRTQLRAMSLNAVVDDLIARGFIAERLVSDAPAILEQLEAWTGLTPAWKTDAIPERPLRPESVVFVVASFALAVEYVWDLKRPPLDEVLMPLRALARPLVEACRGLAAHLRRAHAELYQRIADETETWLVLEAEHAEATDLGRIDTFRFEEDKVLLHALDALALGDYPAVLADAETRAEPAGDHESFWTRDPARRAAWLIARDAARLGSAVEAAPAPGLATADTLDELVSAYAERGAGVDRLHRVLEQRRVAALFPGVPYFEALRQRADRMRDVWVAWADDWAKVMSRICRERGFLPSAGLMQRTVFEDVVVPLVRDAKDARTGVEAPVALFVVDALRFEMLGELSHEMAATPSTIVSLKPRLAELPTVTSVGMNALAPTAAMSGPVPLLRPLVSRGERKIKIDGFTTGELRVSAQAERWRAMYDRVGGAAAPAMALDEVVSTDAASLKQRVGRSRLLIVHSLELDNAGESGVGTIVFEQVLQKLRAAWKLLRDADVRRFVVTSDHGFLVLDGLARAPEPQGRKIDPERRHVLTESAVNEPGRVRVALRDLGYVGVDALHLVVSETTNVFDRGARSASFVHGGNSLQERVIPVLVAIHKASAGGSAGRYVVRANARPGVQGMHCIGAVVEAEERAQMSLAFAKASQVDLVLRVADGGAGVVEVVQTRDGAELVGSTLRATVGRSFEVFFRITGANEARARLELIHLGAEQEVVPATVAEWFETGGGQGPATAPAAPSWLDVVGAEFRRVYEHLSDHGVVTEDELAGMLAGGARAARRFSRQLDVDQPKLPFQVRLEVVDGVKRWVREGRGT